MRTERKRILCRNKLHDATNTLDILQEPEILNFISVPVGATLMTLIFSVTGQGDKTNDDTDRNGTKIHMSHSYIDALEPKFVPAELRHSSVLICYSESSESPGASTSFSDSISYITYLFSECRIDLVKPKLACSTKY